ncbi:MAG: hypothetical protein ACF8CQ_15145 [Rhodopirellula sp. JB044]|uniref:hypothetical protein n=1 Tax=Rhodopirellula sp. JB044 TaxID=3342844 RepID=UPI00370A966A
MNRRQWIQASVRWSLATVIAAVAWMLAKRRLASECSRPIDACRDCVVVQRCALPAAAIERAKRQEPRRV